MKRVCRLVLFCAAVIAALALAPRTSIAQGFPARSITLVVPFAPGGATDVSARIVADHMSRTLGQQVVVQNAPGAGGTVGSTRVMRAEPDGYTILMGHVGTHAVAVSLYPSLAYKPDQDFAPIGLVSEFPMLITARRDFPADDLKGFIAAVTKDAARMNVGHAGVGSVFFNTCLLLHSILKVSPTMVPFNGGLPAMNALVAGQVDYICADATTAIPQVEAKTVKAYATASRTRIAAIPEVPTAAEAGLPAFETSAWFGLFAPKATPVPVVARLSAALDAALSDAGTRKRMQALGTDVPALERRGAEPLRALVVSEIARWTPIIRVAGVRAD